MVPVPLKLKGVPLGPPCRYLLKYVPGGVERVGGLYGLLYRRELFGESVGYVL